MMEQRNISPLTGTEARSGVPARSAFFDAPAEHQEKEHKPASVSIVSIVVRYWILLAASALGCAIAAFLFSQAQTPVYDASVVIEIQDFNDNMLNTGDVDAVARTTNSGDSYFETEIEALSMTSLLNRVWERLKSEPEFNQPVSKSKLDVLKRYLRLPIPVADARQRGIQMLRAGQQITAPKTSSRLVRISYSAADPKFAARVANTMAEEFISQNTEMRLDATRRTSSWLTQEIEDLRLRLQSSEKALTNFGDAAGLVFTGDKESVAVARLRQVQDELSKAQADRIVKQGPKRDCRAWWNGGPGALFDGGPLREYQLKLADAKQRVAEAEAMYTANHPKVQQARADLAVIQASIDAEVRNVSQRTTADFQAARLREQLLNTAFSDQARAVTAQETQSARYMLMKNEVETNRQLYDSMLQKVKSRHDVGGRVQKYSDCGSCRAPVRPLSSTTSAQFGRGSDYRLAAGEFRPCKRAEQAIRRRSGIQLGTDQCPRTGLHTERDEGGFARSQYSEFVISAFGVRESFGTDHESGQLLAYYRLLQGGGCIPSVWRGSRLR